MSEVPGQLDVQWSAAAVTIATRPLRRSETEPFWTSALGTAGLLCFLATLPLALLSAFDVVDEAFPPLLLAVLAGFAVVGEAALHWRRENAHLTLTIDPLALSMVHRMGRMPVVTERFELDRIQRVELAENGTLRLVLRDGRVVSEPLPGLTGEARQWIVATLHDARRTNADFWRGQVASAESQEAMRRLTDRATSRG